MIKRKRVKKELNKNSLDIKDNLNQYVLYLMYECGFSENTIQAYSRDLNSFINYADKKNINQYNEDDLRNYLVHLRNNNYSDSSISRYVIVIKNFFFYLFERKYLKSDPMGDIENFKPNRKLPDILTHNEVEKLINSPDIGATDGYRDIAILELLYSSGLRVSELINLKINNINFESKLVRCLGKGNKERVVPIGKHAIDAILKYLKFREYENNTDLFITKRRKKFTREGLWKLVKRHAAKVGIKKNIFPHAFRHTCATHLLKGGANLRYVQNMMGHTQINTTQIYTHLNNRDLKETHKEYHPRGKRKITKTEEIIMEIINNQSIKKGKRK